MQALWSANTSVAHCDAGTMDGGVHLITHLFTRNDLCGRGVGVLTSVLTFHSVKHDGSTMGLRCRPGGIWVLAGWQFGQQPEHAEQPMATIGVHHGLDLGVQVL